MLAQEIIRAKRDGAALTPEQIQEFVTGLVSGNWSEGQAAALAMAVFLNGMNRDEVVALTRAMAHSGTVLNWAGFAPHGPVLDKHSTGGVGDKVSLMLAPMLAACGAVVPMISGRGLGHTGGTLDKLESIPGYRATPDLPALHAALRQAGCAIIGQTADLAPADRRLYAIRDVTATVESIPLITASILSKKLAAGLQGLVLDVKVGNGAFAHSPSMAQALAQSLQDVANGAGLPTRALITDMNQVLGWTAGNALEVREALDFLAGRALEPRLRTVTLDLGTQALLLGGLASCEAEAAEQLEHALQSGRALEHFSRMVAALGGPTDLADHPDRYLPAAPVQRPVPAPRAGILTAMDTRQIGLLVVELGGGRRVASDPIDPRVGLSAMLPLGQAVQAGDPLAVLHAATEADWQRGCARMQEVVRVGEVGIQ